MPTLDRILVPVDFSETSKAGLIAAVKMAERLGASVHLLYVWTAPVFLAPTAKIRVTSAKTVELGDLVRQDVDELMTALIARTLSDSTVQLTKEIVFGDPATAIITAAEHFDLVVMGTHQRKGPLRLWLGSVAEKVVRLSPVPVLTVPRRDDAKDAAATTAA
ncbi:MAG: universal stress protein [Deltaproteobacteria bacterium]|nr:universal stress protein [Deltaproteobacteria bacterium]